MKNYFVIISIILTGCVNTPSSKISESNTEAGVANEKQAPVNSIDATVLLSDYNHNSVNASQLYEGKYYNITGKINRVSTDVFGKPFVCMANDGVHLTFENKNDNFANLSDGQTVTIKGKIGNYLLGTIMVHDCTLSR